MADTPLSERAAEAASWQEVTDHGRLGYGIAAAALAAVPAGETEPISALLDELVVAMRSS